MANNNIGGFFVSLGMKVDQSFKAGEEALTKLIGTGTKAVAAVVGLAKVSGVVENSNLKLAKAIGISGEELRTWQDSVSKAGVSAGAFTASMSQIENKMQKLKMGEIDQGLAKSLGMLGIGYDQFAGMDAGTRISRVFASAQAMQDQAKAAALVGDVLGSSAREYYDWLALSGRTLSGELAATKALSFETEETMKSAAAFNAEFNGVMNSTKSIGLLISSKIGEKLTPVLKTVETILAKNKEFIASGIVGVIDTIGKIGNVFVQIGGILTGESDPEKIFGKIVNAVKSFGGTAIETSIKLLKDLVEVVKSLFDGDWEMVGNHLKQFFDDLGGGLKKLLIGEQEVADVAKKSTNSMAEGTVIAGTMLFGDEESKNELNKVLTERAVKNQTLEQKAEELLKKDFGGELPGTFGTFGYLLGITDKKKLSDLSNESIDVLNEILTEKGSFKGTPWENYIEGLDTWHLRHKGEKLPYNSVKDGIIAPGGHVTQVAPDDWVIAARNLGDVASAFMPQSMGAGVSNTASYTITQEFNFNGGGKDIASEVMRQAYRGTQNGLLDAMNRSTQRLQLMPGLR